MKQKNVTFWSYLEGIKLMESVNEWVDFIVQMKLRVTLPGENNEIQIKDYEEIVDCVGVQGKKINSESVIMTFLQEGDEQNSEYEFIFSLKTKFQKRDVSRISSLGFIMVVKNEGLPDCCPRFKTVEIRDRYIMALTMLREAYVT